MRRFSCIVAAFCGHWVSADCVLYQDAVVFTGAAEKPDASWFAVEHGRFAAVGAQAIPARWLACSQRVSLGGAFVMAGFVDAHTHFVDGGLSLLQLDLGLIRTPTDLAARLREAKPVGGWILARNLGLEPFSGALPSHASMPETNTPMFVGLKGGHQAYVNRAGLARLGLSADTAAVLNDEAAWDALRVVYASFSPGLIVEAILAAQHKALGYGVTAIGDNTFFPDHMAQLVRMQEAGAFKMRVWSRSFGPEPITKFLMRGMGTNFRGAANPRIRFWGEKFFVTGALSLAAGGTTTAASDVRLTEAELEDAFLFAGPYGLAFHVQSRAGTERILAARQRVGSRRRPGVIDILDHCGACSGDLVQRISASGLRVTLTPGQLHDLPDFERAGRSAQALLRFRELFAAGLRPALTSDWPYGGEMTYADLPDSYHRLEFSPLAGVAVAVSGRTPAGEPIPHLDERTISLADALRGYTRYGALLLGAARDLGHIAAGTRADFVVLPRSPFDVDPVELYRMDVVATYIEGEKVYGSGAAPQWQAKHDQRFDAVPWGKAISPVIGYNPVPGLLLGAGFFFYSYSERGPLGSVVLIGAPFQQRARLETELTLKRAFGLASPRAVVTFDTLRSFYYGFGNGTVTDDAFLTHPIRLDSQWGMAFRLARRLEFGTYGLFSFLRDESHVEIDRESNGREGAIEGNAAGGRLELSHDTRDSLYSTRRGGRRVLWEETWGLQSDEARPLARVGATLTQFVPLYAPNWILALKAEGAVGLGEHSYLTAFTLGGSHRLRGFLGNRFRGDHYALGTAEVRFPLVWIMSAALFGEAGRVWTDDASPEGPALHVSGGGGLRFGLPPDGLIKLRFDAGFSADQWGIFFTFNEAY